MTIGYLSAAIAFALVAFNLVAMALAVARWRRKPGSRDFLVQAPVSLLVPLRGIEAYSEETIAATFALDWPDYEVIFCVQSLADPIVGLVEAALARHPHFDARLLVGNDAISANPKLNNCAKGWRIARHDWIIMADSNVLMPRDYIQRLMKNVTPATSLVVSMPWGTRPRSFMAEVECALLNTHQARWQFAAAAMGRPFAQGKNMMWRRKVLDAAGGLAALGSEAAEDAAATRLLRETGGQIVLVDMPFEQPLARRSAHEVWARHTRWARLRRATFPFYFMPEVLTGAFPPAGLAALSAYGLGANPYLAAGLVGLALYGPELALAAWSGMAVRWSTLPAMVTRDLMLPAMYVDAWLFDGFTWHGQSMSVADVEHVPDSIGAQ